MDTPHLQLKETDENIYVLYKEGLPGGRTIDLNGDLKLDLGDEFFDLAPSSLPAAKKIRIDLLVDQKETWVEFMTLQLENSVLTVNLHCHFDNCADAECEYALNVAVLLAKIADEAESYGFIPDDLYDLDTCGNFKKKFTSKGNLRDKIKTAIDILETLRAKKEKEMLEAISTGNLFIKVPRKDESEPGEAE